MPGPVLYSAGSNAKGQLATGDCKDTHTFLACSFALGGPTQAALPPETNGILQIACGSNHTLALLERFQASSQIKHELWGCGDGSRGQLGKLDVDGSSTSTVIFRPLTLQLPSPDYSVKLITAGWESSYIVLSKPQHNDVLVSFGANDFGDLALGEPTQIEPGGVHVVEFEPPPTINPTEPYTLSIDSLAASLHHVTAVVNIPQADSTRSVVYGWGSSRHGQLGNVVKSGRPLPFIATPHRVIEAPMGQKYLSVAVGAQHTVILESTGRTITLGSNRKHQYAGIDTLQSVSYIGCTWNGTYAVTSQGGHWSILATGDNTKGQLGFEHYADEHHSNKHLPKTAQFPFNPDTHALLKVVCGSEHVLCLFTLTHKHPQGQAKGLCSEVWGWGWNEHGNLGLGHARDVNVPLKIWPLSDEEASVRVTDVWAGCGTSWVFCVP